MHDFLNCSRATARHRARQSHQSNLLGCLLRRSERQQSDDIRQGQSASRAQAGDKHVAHVFRMRLHWLKSTSPSSDAPRDWCPRCGLGALKRVGDGAPVGARAMGACCRRQSARHDGTDKPWKLYSDREEEWTAPSTTAQRDRRWRPSTVSLSSGELERYTQDESRPRRAQHAAEELSRRARARG